MLFIKKLVISPFKPSKLDRELMKLIGRRCLRAYPTTDRAGIITHTNYENVVWLWDVLAFKYLLDFTLGPRPYVAEEGYWTTKWRLWNNLRPHDSVYVNM